MATRYVTIRWSTDPSFVLPPGSDVEARHRPESVEWVGRSAGRLERSHGDHTRSESGQGEQDVNRCPLERQPDDDRRRGRDQSADRPGQNQAGRDEEEQQIGPGPRDDACPRSGGQHEGRHEGDRRQPAEVVRMRGEPGRPTTFEARVRNDVAGEELKDRAAAADRRRRDPEADRPRDVCPAPQDDRAEPEPEDREKDETGDQPQSTSTSDTTRTWREDRLGRKGRRR